VKIHINNLHTYDAFSYTSLISSGCIHR